MNGNAKARMVLTTFAAAGVFVISYGHIFEVARSAGNAVYQASLYPVAIDILILVCALTLTARVGVSKQAKFWATGGRWFGFAATIYCNVAASDFASAQKVVVNLIPAISLILLVEVVIHGWKGTAASRRSAKA